MIKSRQRVKVKLKHSTDDQIKTYEGSSEYRMDEQIKIEDAWTNVDRRHDIIKTTERWSNQDRRQMIKSREKTDDQFKTGQMIESR